MAPRSVVYGAVWIGTATRLAMSNVFDICPAPTKGGVYLTTSDSAWFAEDDEPLSESCQWSIDDLETAEQIYSDTVDIDPDTIESGAPEDFIYQRTNAWGIYPNDIGLIGCNYIYVGGGSEYRNFMLQFDTINEDNDGVGAVFGWKSIVDHYVAHNINDDWPKEGNAIDGYPGPNMKIKRRFQSCQTHQSAQDPCFQTLASLNAPRGGHENKLSPATFPSSDYATGYVPYAMNTCDGVTKPTRYYLIVKDGTARYMRENEADGRTVAVWTDNLGSYYTGGKIGLFTYADQLFFYNIKVWDLDAMDLSKTKYCNGHGTCDVDGLCKCKKGYGGVACEKSANGQSSSGGSKSKKSSDDDAGDSSSAVTGLVATSFVLNIFMILAIGALVYQRHGKPAGVGYQMAPPGNDYRSPLPGFADNKPPEAGMA